MLGGLSLAFFIALRAAGFKVAALSESELRSAIVIWSIRDVVASYIIAFPLLILARRLGVRHLMVFVLISIVAGYPIGHMLANPANYAWQPTENDFTHGTYWDLLWSYMLTSGVTGLCFGMGTMFLSSSPTAKTRSAIS
jgi:peptidoglycan/LPS O-acetylase OafA/YrhL